MITGHFLNTYDVPDSKGTAKDNITITAEELTFHWGETDESMEVE